MWESLQNKIRQSDEIGSTPLAQKNINKLLFPLIHGFIGSCLISLSIKV